MGSRVGSNLVSDLFQGVPYSKELSEAKERIANLESQKGLLKIPVVQIEPNPDQPRKTFSDDTIKLLARSLERDGQQHPILVFQKEDQKYFLFDGERRWRAALSLSWEFLEGIIISNPDDPDTLHRKVLLANHHRENMNPLDLAEAIVQEISSSKKIPQDDVPKLLNRSVKRLIRNRCLENLTTLVDCSQIAQIEGLSHLEKSGLITPEESAVLEILLSLQLNPHSVNTNIIPGLRLFEDLKESIRSEGLGIHQAFALQKLSAKNLGGTEQHAKSIREQVTRKVIDEKLSVTTTRKLIKDNLDGQNNVDSQLSKITQATLTSLQKITVEEIQREELEILEKALKDKAREIRKVLKGSIDR